MSIPRTYKFVALKEKISSHFTTRIGRSTDVSSGELQIVHDNEKKVWRTASFRKFPNVVCPEKFR